MNDILILAATAGASALVGVILTHRALAAKVERYRTAYYATDRELAQAQNRIHRALAQVTPGANATVARMARLLCGRQA